MSTIALTIPTFNLPLLKTKLEKINARAKKLGLQPFVLSGDENTPVSSKIVKDRNGTSVEVFFLSLTITGKMPYLSGYTIRSILEHDDGDTTFITNIGDEAFVVPDRFMKDEKGYCNHCNTRRRRKKTIILEKSSSGELIQVGRSCLKDFISVSAENYLSVVESLHSLTNEIKDYSDRDDDLLTGIAPGDLEVRLSDAFEAVSTIINHTGFVPSNGGDHDSVPTKIVLEQYFFGKDCVAFQNEMEITDQDKKNAVEILDWIRDSAVSNAESSFFFNLTQLIQSDLVKAKRFGYVAGAMSAFLRSKEKAKKASIKFADSYLTDDIKKRIVLKSVEVVSVKTIDGYYGAMDLCTLKTQENHCLVWFSSNAVSFKEGDVIDCKATIKDKKLYNGTHQTVLNRLTMI